MENYRSVPSQNSFESNVYLFSKVEFKKTSVMNISRWCNHSVMILNEQSSFSQLPQKWHLIFLPMLYIWTYASILSYDKMLSYAKYLISDICGQHLNNSELHKYYMLTSYDNIIFWLRQFSTTLAEMSDLSLLGKLRKTPVLLENTARSYPPFQKSWI